MQRTEFDSLFEWRLIAINSCGLVVQLGEIVVHDDIDTVAVVIERRFRILSDHVQDASGWVEPL